jgi:RNA cap guanine-N2 methyltransferase
MNDLFPHKKGVDYSQIHMTEEGAYSITRKNDSERIVGCMKELLITTNDKTITDSTGCVGGDTINFAMNFKHVHSIEIKKDNYTALKANVNTFVLKNVTIYNGDATIGYKWYTDVLYVDPPWGGPNYKEHPLLDLNMSNKRLDTWLEEVLLRETRPRYIFLKLPQNYNFQRLTFLPNVDLAKQYRIRRFVLFGMVINLDKRH